MKGTTEETNPEILKNLEGINSTIRELGNPESIDDDPESNSPNEVARNNKKDPKTSKSLIEVLFISTILYTANFKGEWVFLYFFFIIFSYKT